jgi:hypothetical protein
MPVLSTISTLYDNLSTTNQKSFAFSYSNINLFKITNNQPVREFMETVHNNKFLQLIIQATRKCGDSYSLIDHIFYNNFDTSFSTVQVQYLSCWHQWSFYEFYSIPQQEM